ncbi:hypothetical protein [Tsuneonella sp. HG222]
MISRRGVLKGSVLVASGILSADALAKGSDGPQLVVFDGRDHLSRQFARARLGPSIDIVADEASGWRAMRSLNGAGRIVGLTRWGEFLMARSFLEEGSLRVTASSVHSNGLVYWEMS